MTGESDTPGATSSQQTSTSELSETSVSASATTSSRSTSSSTSSSSAVPTPTTTTSAAPTPPSFEPKTYNGTGDDVITIETPTDGGAVLEFTCETCSGNTVVKSSDLLVNEIGAYSGSHIIPNTDKELEIQADGDWTVTVSSLADVSNSGASANGSGDSVILLGDEVTKAAISHEGQGNFVVRVYGITTGDADLAVNEIGSYSGTVRLSGPAFVQVKADGQWSIEGS